MRIALHWTVEVDPDAWAAHHGIDRKRVRDHIRAYVQYELSQLPVALTPVLHEPAEPATKPAAAADGRERLGTALPAAPGSVTPGRAAAAASGQPPADATASRPIAGDSRQPSTTPAAVDGTQTTRPGHTTQDTATGAGGSARPTLADAASTPGGRTTAAPRPVAALVLRPDAPGPGSLERSPGWEHHPRRRPALRSLAGALAAVVAAVVLALAAVQPGPVDPPAVTPLPAPAASYRRAARRPAPVPDWVEMEAPGGCDPLDDCTQAAFGEGACLHRGTAVGDLNTIAMCEACRRTVREALEALPIYPPLQWHPTWGTDS
jgi:hypothetical protein